MVVQVAEAEQRQIDSIWHSWGDLTRFHRSMRIASAREQDIWASVRTHTGDVEISTQHDQFGGTYEVTLDEHLAALGSPDTLNGLVLVQSWSLAEALARVSLKTDVLAERLRSGRPRCSLRTGRPSRT